MIATISGVSGIILIGLFRKLKNKTIIKQESDSNKNIVVLTLSDGSRLEVKSEIAKFNVY